MQQCSVVSRCGRFDIAAAANRAKEIASSVERVRFTVSERGTAATASPLTFFAALTDQGLEQCAANSGFRPAVPMLVKMMFSALAGASATASFAVVTSADDPNFVKQHSPPAAAAGSVIVLLFQLRGDFASPSENAIIASLGIPLQRCAPGTAPPAPPPPPPSFVPPPLLPSAAAAAAAPQSGPALPSSSVMALSLPVVGSNSVSNSSKSNSNNDDVLALTRILKETQQFLQQQREETAQRFERINVELKHRAAECSSLRRDVDILKSTLSSRRTAPGSGSGGQRFQSPGSRPGSAYRQPAVAAHHYNNKQRHHSHHHHQHQRSNSNGSNGGCRHPTPPRPGSAGSASGNFPQHMRRFDSPNRPPGILMQPQQRPSAAFGTSTRNGAPLTPNRSNNSNQQNSHGNDGSRGSIGSGISVRSDRMYFGN